MKTAEDYFWENLPKRNLTDRNVIDRKKVNFDDIINLMESYAKEHAIEFADHIIRYNGQVAVLYGRDEKMREKDTDVTDLYTKWLKTK